MSSGAHARERRFRGEPAVEIVSGPLAAVFVPDVGMTGVSLQYDGREYLALPGGLDALRAGRTGGLPLLAPWANRLSERRYRAAGITVDLEGLTLPVDGNGLPIHGFLVGQPGWKVEQLGTRGDAARAQAAMIVDGPAFPYPHRIEITATVRDPELRVVTRFMPTGTRSVPIAFGWHPYLRLPSASRSQWRLRLPARRHLILDERGIPTGEVVPEVSERAPIGRRTFDDGYALGRDGRLAIENDLGQSISLRCGAGYSYAQVWVPRGKPFAALEPMAAPTNALVDRKATVVRRGDSYTATFTLTVDHPD